MRLGSYFLPDYEGLGRNCWDKGCDYNDSLKTCKEGGGSLAIIRNRNDSKLIHQLLDKLGTTDPLYIGDSFQFYIGLKEKSNDCYMWEDGSEPAFFNWSVNRHFVLN